MTELALEENIRQILPTLPLPIQKFFEERKLGTISRLLMERYALHLDQGAVLEQELMFLLLGLRSPDEFATELYANLPISKQTVRDIINDVNQEVFVPLREEEMKSGGMNVAPSAKSTTVAPVDSVSQRDAVPPSVAVLPQTGSPNATQPASHFHLQNKINPPPRPAQQPSPVKPLVSVLQGNPATRFAQPSRPNMIAAPSPAASSTLLEDHEEPHIEFNKAPVPTSSIPAQKTPAPQSPLGEVLSRIIPPGGRPAFAPAPKIAFPTQVPPRANPSQTPSVTASPAAASQPNRSLNVPKPILSGAPAPVVPKAPSAPAKPYSTDPYREPIE